MKKGLLIAGVTALLSCGLVVGLAASNSGLVESPIFGTRAARQVVDFSEETITRRIWIVNADDWHWSAHYAYVWTKGATKHETTVEIKNWVDFTGEDSYYAGIAYIDVTLEEGGNDLGVIVKNTEDWSGTSTVDNDLPAFTSSSADVIFLNSGTTGGKRNSEVKAAGMKTGQLVKVLNTISTCSANYQNGYNAYPQLNKDFFVPSATEISQYGAQTDIPDLDSEFHDGYKLTDKINKLESLYNANGWTTGS